MNWNEEKFFKDYHVNQSGNLIPLCSLLGCFDQICYFELRKTTKFNPWIFFCDDINPYIEENGNIGIRSTGIKYLYTETQDYLIEGNYFTRISEIIGESGEVILCTAFNYVPEYCWCEEGRDSLHIDHYSYLLAEDAENYFIADSPMVFLNIEKIRAPQNPSIVIIPKEHFAEAFDQYCLIKKIRIKESISQQEEYFFLIKNLKEMIQYYKSDEVGTIIGRMALLYLLEKCEQNDDAIFKNLFKFHLIISRRLILKRCLLICSKKLGDCRNVFTLLDRTINSWTTIKQLSLECLYYGKDVSERAKPVVEDLLEQEDRLMQSITQLVNKQPL